MRKKSGVYNGVGGVCNQRDSFSVARWDKTSHPLGQPTSMVKAKF